MCCGQYYATQAQCMTRKAGIWSRFDQSSGMSLERRPFFWRYLITALDSTFSILTRNFWSVTSKACYAKTRVTIDTFARHHLKVSCISVPNLIIVTCLLPIGATNFSDSPRIFNRWKFRETVLDIVYPIRLWFLHKSLVVSTTQEM